MTGLRTLLPPLLAFLSACGYAVGPDGLYAHRSVQVRIADNASERRLHEFDLTQAVIRELQAGGLRVNASDADVRLDMTIADIREPALVEGKLDVVTVGSVSFRIELEVVDVGSGKVRVKDQRTESASFVVSRGEGRDTARAQVLDRLARWAVSKLERDW